MHLCKEYARSTSTNIRELKQLRRQRQRKRHSEKLTLLS